MTSKSRVSYFHDSDISGYYYGSTHVMKPFRLTLTHSLVVSYDLTKKMKVYRPYWASNEQLKRFHSEEYIDFLSRVTPQNKHGLVDQLEEFNLGGVDCPVFEGCADYCSLYAGGSIQGASQLVNNQCDIAINWSGGLHHARKSEASGFCYVNDIVLGILELLRVHPRVLYIDIDIHHGDGVQEAFYQTDRVMTVSFHNYGNDFFPGTGDEYELGKKGGKYFSLNAPLREGITDFEYITLFKTIITETISVYRPTAVVLQCGTDSLGSDRLGRFNLSFQAHGECVRFVKTFQLPTLVVGGGGYTIKNVSRCWTYETGLLLDQELNNELPFNDFFEYFGPDFQLTPDVYDPTIKDLNTRESIDQLKATLLQNLRTLQGAPSVQMQKIPPELYLREQIDVEQEAEPDRRDNMYDNDFHVEQRNEFYESDSAGW